MSLSIPTRPPTPLRRKRPLRRSGRLRAKPRPGWAEKRAEILVRDQHRCRVWGCGAKADDVHHCLGRGGKKTRAIHDDPDALVALCRRHHDEATFGVYPRKLVVVPLGGGTFDFCYPTSKAEARDANSLAINNSPRR